MEAKTIGKTLQTMNLGKDLQKPQSGLNTRGTTTESKVQRSLNGELALSLYSDTCATPDEIAKSIKRLRAAFPKMGNGFFDVLYERLVKNGFTGQRLEDAVNHVIDSFQYKELNVADVVSFDKRAKLHTYNQMCNEIANGQSVMDDYQRLEIDGKNYWVRKVDLENAKR
jgi:hypothetical protein